jgi:AraC family ethanolamine operon transcriptional activator
MSEARPFAIQKLQADDLPEPAFFPAGMAASLRFQDGDELTAAIRQWDHQLTQLGRGHFRGTLTLAHTALLQFYRADWSPGFYIQGAPPPDSIAFGIQCGGSRPAVWHGIELAGNEVIMLDRRQEIDCQTKVDCDMIVVSIRAETFARHVAALCGRYPSATNMRVAVADPIAQHSLARHWIGLLESSQQLGSRLADRRIAAQIEAEALEMLLGHIVLPNRRATLTERRRAAVQARRYMVLNMDDPLTIADICQAIHTTERTLHLGFREAFGMTPKRFLKVLRLNAVRNDLLRAEPHASVTEAAYRRGFFHLSNFAADYRQMFGELPSSTLFRA